MQRRFARLRARALRRVQCPRQVQHCCASSGLGEAPLHITANGTPGKKSLNKHCARQHARLSLIGKLKSDQRNSVQAVRQQDKNPTALSLSSPGQSVSDHGEIILQMGSGSAMGPWGRQSRGTGLQTLCEAAPRERLPHQAALRLWTSEPAVPPQSAAIRRNPRPAAWNRPSLVCLCHTQDLLQAVTQAFRRTARHSNQCIAEPSPAPHDHGAGHFFESHTPPDQLHQSLALRVVDVEEGTSVQPRGSADAKTLTSCT